MKKIFIPDTNVIISGTKDGKDILTGFVGGQDANDIVITGTVLQELDKLKSYPGDIGYNAREFIHSLNELRLKGDLTKGVSLKRGKVIVEPDGVKAEYLPAGFDISSPDNRIISTCIYLAKKHPRSHYVFISNDFSCCVNADICFKAANVKIVIEGYENSKVRDEDLVYTGHCEIATDKRTIDKFYEKKVLSPDEIVTLSIEDNDIGDLTENEFFTFTCGSQSALSVYQHGNFTLIPSDQSLGSGGWIKPKNKFQAYAIWLLKNEDIPLKILIGSPGTGKTFLSLAAGMDKTIGTKKHGARYDALLISRPITGFKEVGFMPGDLDDKLRYNNLSFTDNISQILKHGGKEDNEQIDIQVNDLFATKTIEVCGLSFIRGRSLSDSFLICDEAQNANATLMRDVVTRAGEGTSVVLSGDPNQIDVSFLNKYTNGLEFAASRMRGSDKCAILRFSAEASVRSPLAKEAAERMR